jgi:hypothetical protein
MTSTDSRHFRPGTIVMIGGTIVMIGLCAPTVLSVATILIVCLFRPVNRMPLETVADRMFVELIVWSTPIALLGIPLLIAGIGMGALLVWRAGPNSRFGRLALATMVVALAAGLYTVLQTRHAIRQIPHVPHRMSRLGQL